MPANNRWDLIRGFKGYGYYLKDTYSAGQPATFAV